MFRRPCFSLLPWPGQHPPTERRLAACLATHESTCERDADCGMTHSLADYLWVHASAQQMRRVGMKS